jgi:hypothetical protein
VVRTAEQLCPARLFITVSARIAELRTPAASLVGTGGAFSCPSRMGGMDPRSLLSTLARIACWTIAGMFLGLLIVSFVSSADSRPAPGMCGNTVLDPAIVYGAALGFLGGSFTAATRPLPNS